MDLTVNHGCAEFLGIEGTSCNYYVIYHQGGSATGSILYSDKGWFLEIRHDGSIIQRTKEDLKQYVFKQLIGSFTIRS